MLQKGRTMNEGFEKIKKRHLVDTVIKSILIALSLGAFVFGAMLLIFKLLIIDFSPAYHLLISVGAAAICGVVCFFLLHKSALALARSLDEEFALGEKVQTMVRFKDDRSDMLALQRENAEETLKGIKTKKPIAKRFASALICLALSVCMLLPAVIVPRGVEEAPPPPPFSFTEDHEFAMNMLIEDIESRDSFNTETRDAIVAELRSLIDRLKSTHTLDGMYMNVIASIVKVDALVEEISTYKTVCVAIDKSENHDMKLIARSILNLQGYEFGGDLGDIRENYKGDTLDPKTNEVILTLTEKLSSLSTELVTKLATLTDYESETLTVGLGTFAAELASALEEENANKQQSLIDKAFENVSREVGEELTAQWNAKDARTDVISRLTVVFEIPKSMIPPLLGDALPTLSTSEGEGGSGDDTENGASGGYGEGNELFGSNDLIYDPFSEDGAKYVLYGEAYDDYYKTIEAILLDESVSTEAKEILREYFRKLSDGTKKN